MAKPTKTHWGTGDPSYQIEPSAGKKVVGWLSGEKPPYQYFNQQMDEVANWEDYFEAKTENIEPVIIRSSGTLTWNGSTVVTAAATDIVFRVSAGASRINRLAAASYGLTDGQVLIVRRDKTGASPVNLSAGTYGSLAFGQYAILNESSLTLADVEYEMILFRRRGTDLEIPYLGQVIPTGTTFTIGQGGTVGSHVHAASDITSGTFADARIAQSNVTQHQAALALAASQITSGTFADARVAQSNVTQHQAALTIAETQITDGSLLARVAGNETISGSWTFPSTDPPAANATTRQSMVKAWMYFLAGVIHGGADTFIGYNISSMGDADDDGFYDINWNTNFSNTTYALAGMGHNGSDIFITSHNTNTVGTAHIYSWNGSGAVGSNQDFSIMAIGNQ